MNDAYYEGVRDNTAERINIVCSNYKDLEKENNKLKEENKSLNYSISYSVHLSLREQIEELKESNERLQLKIDDFHEANCNLKDKIMKTEQENKKLTESNEHLRKFATMVPHASLKDEIQELKKDNERLSSLLDDLSRKNDQLKREANEVANWVNAMPAEAKIKFTFPAGRMSSIPVWKSRVHLTPFQ